MADDFWNHHFGTDEDGPQDNLDDAIEHAKPFVYPSRGEMLEALFNANASARRLDGTIYWDRAHDSVNQLLDDIVGR